MFVKRADILAPYWDNLPDCPALCLSYLFVDIKKSKKCKSVGLAINYWTILMIVCKRADVLAPWEPSVWSEDRLKLSSAAMPSPPHARVAPTHPSLCLRFWAGNSDLLSTNHSAARRRRPMGGSDFGVCGRGWWAVRPRPRGFSRQLEIGGKVAW